jgi:thiamine-monophosphate kinase
VTDELGFVAALAARLGAPPPGELWAGDDAAVVTPPDGPLLLAVDPMVAGVHFLEATADVGWAAVARNVSDLAAMGGRPLHALVSLVVPKGMDVSGVVDGLVQATSLCPIVGGDTSTGATLVITVAVTGTVDGGAVTRSGARPGDAVFVTGPLGGVPARPQPRVAEGTAARLGGATAMIDISDGLALDLRRLAAASGVGMILDVLPLAEGTSWDDAVTRGESYELLFTASNADRVVDAFARADLEPPIEIGRCTSNGDELVLGDGPLPEGGWEHTW